MAIDPDDPGYRLIALAGRRQLDDLCSFGQLLTRCMALDQLFEGLLAFS